VAHAALEAGSGPLSERVSEVVSEERATPTIGGAVASVGAPGQSAPPKPVGTDAPDGGAPSGPSGAGDEEKVVGISGRSMGTPSMLGTQRAAPATTEATSTAQATTPPEPTAIAPVPTGGAAKTAIEAPGGSPGKASQSPTRVAPQPTSARASSISPEKNHAVSRTRSGACVRGRYLSRTPPIAAGSRGSRCSVRAGTRRDL
jgi:hypothetical protein